MQSNKKNYDKLFAGSNYINIFKLNDFNYDSASILLNYEFSTPNCHKIEVYEFGKMIGRGAYAEVKEAVNIKSGEKFAIKQYDRYKLLDIQRKK